MTVTWIPETAHILELTGLTSSITGQLVSDATVSVTIVDAHGQEVAGETWPLTVSPVRGAPGTYRATLSASLAINPRQSVDAVVVADAGTGLKRTWHVTLQSECCPSTIRL
jgi:hypothetical protein